MAQEYGFYLRVYKSKFFDDTILTHCSDSLNEYIYTDGAKRKGSNKT